MTATVPTIQEKWDRAYAGKDVAGDRPPRMLDECAHLLPTHGRALDVACGLGAASIFLARRSLQVIAYDISPVAIEKLTHFAEQHALPIKAEVVDLTQAQIPTETFEVIHVSRFMERALCPTLVRALRPGGLLCYQTYTVESFDAAPPKNPVHRLLRGELLEIFHELSPLYYREDALVGDTSQGLRNEASLVAQKRRPAPRFFVEWVRQVTGGDNSLSLSCRIEEFHRRISALPDPLAPLVAGETTARSREWGLVENAEFVIVPDSCVPALRALVVVKGGYLLPTDMPEAALHRLGQVVDAIADAFCQVTRAPSCRSWVPHPDESRSRRLHLFVEPEVAITDFNEKNALWNRVVAFWHPVLAVSNSHGVD
jgi:tellurite methyltransferase